MLSPCCGHQGREPTHGIGSIDVEARGATGVIQQRLHDRLDANLHRNEERVQPKAARKTNVGTRTQQGRHHGGSGAGAGSLQPA